MNYLKFFIILIIFALDLTLGIFIILKNKFKDKSKFYFGFCCICASLWSLFLGFSILLNNPSIYIFNAKLFYIFATLIFVYFYYFSIEFLYKIKLIPKVLGWLIFLGFVLLLYVLFFDLFFVDLYFDKHGIHEVENKLFHLLYGFYILYVLFLSYMNLLIKYVGSYGINKRAIFWVIISTLISFFFGILFSWYLPHINKHYLDWIGPVFTIIMNLSICTLLFKKY